MKTKIRKTIYEIIHENMIMIFETYTLLDMLAADIRTYKINSSVIATLLEICQILVIKSELLLNWHQNHENSF